MFCISVNIKLAAASMILHLLNPVYRLWVEYRFGAVELPGITSSLNYNVVLPVVFSI